MHIYRNTPNLKYICAEWAGEYHIQPKTATDSSGAKADKVSTTTQYLWHHSVDKKHYFGHVKFGMRFFIFLTRKSMFNKK
jgi:hypothetical protein